MIDSVTKIIVEKGVGLQEYVDWILNLLKYTGLSLGSILLFIFIFWLIVNLAFVILCEFIPFVKGIIVILEYILLPGSLMHNVWHVFALKKLNYKTEQTVSFSWGWTRTGIRVKEPLKSMRDGLIFFWAPLMNIPIIIGWIIPGMLLFEWLDSLIGRTIFYWIWLYVLFSLIILGLPDLADMIGPLQISVIKTPEFYLFIVFYIIIAPTTLIFWGWGLTVIFSLLYAISAIYEVEKISQKESARLAGTYDKVFSRTEKPVYILVPPDRE